MEEDRDKPVYFPVNVQWNCSSVQKATPGYGDPYLQNSSGSPVDEEHNAMQLVGFQMKLDLPVSRAQVVVP